VGGSAINLDVFGGGDDALQSVINEFRLRNYSKTIIRRCFKS
jgi:hypothetical protein